MVKPEQEVDISFLYDEEVRIEFRPESKRNRYKIFDNNTEIKPSCPSVTTICSIADFGKSNALSAWASRCVIDMLRGLILPDQIHGAQFLEEAFKNAQANYRNIKQTAADAGTLAHAALERHFSDPTAPPPLADTPVRLVYDEALNWFGQHEIENIGTEIKVYSRRHKVVGTADNISKVDGVVSLLDYKRAKNVYSSYILQLGAYKNMYEEEHPDVKIEQAWILQLHDDGTKPYKYTGKQLDDAYESFVALRRVHEWNRTLGKIKPEEKDWLIDA